MSGHWNLIDFFIFRVMSACPHFKNLALPFSREEGIEKEKDGSNCVNFLRFSPYMNNRLHNQTNAD